MDYAIKFDTNGRRGNTYPIDSDVTQEQLDKWLSGGYIVTSEGDWKYYAGLNGNGKNGTGYIRDPETGKPVDAPPYEPSREEQVNILFAECQADLKVIDAQIVNAIILEDDELVAELKQERADRVEQYQHDLDALEGGDE